MVQPTGQSDNYSCYPLTYQSVLFVWGVLTSAETKFLIFRLLEDFDHERLPAVPSL